MSRPDWHTNAACNTVADPDIFHPSGPGMAQQLQTEAAKKVCRGCPVRDKCLNWQLDFEYGMGRTYREGIYGGLTGVERAQLEATRRRQNGEAVA